MNNAAGNAVCQRRLGRRWTEALTADFFFAARADDITTSRFEDGTGCITSWRVRRLLRERKLRELIFRWINGIE
jgi:hypothetical protein